MPRPPLQRAARSAAQALPPEARAQLRRSGGALLRRLPAPLAREIRSALGVRPRPAKRGRDAERARDALGLAAPGGGRPARGFAGRAAAAVGPDAEASARLERALGEVDVSRRAGGHRTVVGLLAPDLRRSLEAAGYHVVPLVPGTAVAVAGRAEVVVVDLKGVAGLWEGALTSAGVPLMLELMAAVRAASRGGATCWLVVRGPRRTQIGAVQLMSLSTLLPIHPGRPQTRPHFTEDPGDVAHGIADLLTACEESAHA